MAEPTPESTLATAASRYETLTSYREPYLRRGRDAAELTIPALLPPEGSNEATDYARPWQSVGARGVNNLAAKLLLALFPPGVSFFKLEADPKALSELRAKAESEAEDVAGQVSLALSVVEQEAMRWIEGTNLRTVMAEVFKHLVVVGNALLYLDQSGTWKWFRLNDYVVVRDLSGNPVEIIAVERLSERTLPEAARSIYYSEAAVQSRQNDAGNPEKPISLYTRVTRKSDGSWRVVQEICGIEIPETRGSYPKDRSAWIPLVWSRSANEHYGRSLVEDYFGDLYSLESLCHSMVDAAAAMARIVTLVDEGGVTSRKKLAEAPNLAVIEGNAKDISVFSMSEKAFDLQYTQRQANEIEHRLEQAFLLTSSIQRDAERVTAEEIRIMANELEQSLGGVYAGFARELQKPMVDRVLLVLQRTDRLPSWPDKAIVPQIITGIDGLGRTSEYTRLRMLAGEIAATLGPEAVQTYINATAYLTRAAAALGINPESVIRSEEEIAAMRQQAAEMQMAQSLGPQAIRAQADRDIAATQAAAAQPPQ